MIPFYMKCCAEPTQNGNEQRSITGYRPSSTDALSHRDLLFTLKYHFVYIMTTAA